jgi:predicted phage terminase large subunit-like protein
MTASPTCTEAGPEEIRLALDHLRRTVTDNPFIPVDPTEPQAVFLTVPPKEVMYGGAGGGGKSVALLASALQFVTVPGYASLLLRRTFADLSLPDALIPLSHQWLHGTKAHWDGQKHEWRFPGGSSLTFGYLETENDKYRYQGAAFQLIGFDELTQFTDSQYRYLFSRLRRREGLNVPLRMRSATNPGGVGHEWVKRRFIDEQDEDRLFIPASLEDNPYLDRAAYRESLSELDPVTRAQLEAGDWHIRPAGNLFKREWFTGKYLESADVPKLKRRVRYWDLAATEPSQDNPDPDFAAGVLMGESEDGRFIVLDAQEFRDSPAKVEENVAETASRDGREVEVFVEQEPGSSGKIVVDNTARKVLPGYTVLGDRVTGDKTTRAKPFSAACQNGLVWVLRGLWNGLFIDRLTGFGLPGVHDDTTDAAAGAHRALTGGAQPWEADKMQQRFSNFGRWR